MNQGQHTRLGETSSSKLRGRSMCDREATHSFTKQQVGWRGAPLALTSGASPCVRLKSERAWEDAAVSTTRFFRRQLPLWLPSRRARGGSIRRLIVVADVYRSMTTDLRSVKNENLKYHGGGFHFLPFSSLAYAALGRPTDLRGRSLCLQTRLPCVTHHPSRIIHPSPMR